MAEGFVVPKYVPEELVFEFDIYGDPRVGQDVQGDYQRTLKDAPDVFWTPANGGHWMIKRFDYISEVVKTPSHFSVREMQIPRVPNPPRTIPLSLDPPTNIPYRQLMMPAFSPKSVAEMEPTLRMWAKRLVDEVADKGECDFIDAIASRYPVSIFMELMGMDLGRLREFRDLADSLFCAHGGDAITKAVTNIHRVLQEHIDEKRRNPGKDFTSFLINADMNGRKLDEAELMDTVYLLFLGGMDTVTNVTGFTYQHLANDPALQARLVADPTLIPKFVEEGLRCFAVVNTPRLCVQTHERFGVPFHEGDMVLNLLPMGGRDERLLDDPATFSIDRESSPHITFSSGPHLCLGHLLARAEMKILTEEWLKRIPSFTAVPGVTHRFRIGTVCAIHSLPLTWTVKS